MARKSDGKLTILVAEDSTELRIVVEETLKALGHDVAGVENGKIAERLIGERNFDVVITDMLMPEGDGIEVISAVKKQQPSARIIVVTGGGQYVSADYNLTLALRLGANAIIQKPFAPAQLIETLRAIVATAE